MFRPVGNVNQESIFKYHEMEREQETSSLMSSTIGSKAAPWQLTVGALLVAKAIDGAVNDLQMHNCNPVLVPLFSPRSNSECVCSYFLTPFRPRKARQTVLFDKVSFSRSTQNRHLVSFCQSETSGASAGSRNLHSIR